MLSPLCLISNSIRYLYCNTNPIRCQGLFLTIFQEHILCQLVPYAYSVPICPSIHRRESCRGYQVCIHASTSTSTSTSKLASKHLAHFSRPFPICIRFLSYPYTHTLLIVLTTVYPIVFFSPLFLPLLSLLRVFSSAGWVPL